MKTILLAAQALSDIQQGKLSFADFSNNLRAKDFQELNGQEKRQIRTFVSCALHKEQILHFTLLQHGLDALEVTNRAIIAIYLCDRYFLHIINPQPNEVLEAIQGEHDQTLIKGADVVFGKVKSLFPEQLDFKTSFALSLRYNFPITFIDNLIQDLGYNKTQRFLDKYSNVYQIHGRLNLAKVTPDQFFSEHKAFTPINLKHAFIYNSQESIKSLQSYKDCLFYTMPLSDMTVVDQLSQIPLGKVLILEQEKTSIFIDIAKANPDSHVDVIVKDRHRYHVVNSVTKMFDLTHTRVATSDRHELLEAYDLVYLTPSSSNLEQIKARPDFFVTFSLVTDYTSNLFAQLDLAKDKVATGGYLLLKVGSLLRKETSGVTAEFLQKNPDFQLVYDRQYMPYHKEQTIAYYALFRKKLMNEN